MSVARVVGAVVARGGIARTRELKSDGIRGREIAAAFRSGALVRPRNGLYVLPTVPGPEREALSHGGVAACVTAARSLGLWTLDEGEGGPVHTWVHPERHPGRVAFYGGTFGANLPTLGELRAAHLEVVAQDPVMTLLAVDPAHCR